ncbi:MAG: FAD-dependent oxidoreductase [Treponema sp.]|nr:FAD-dependent oxidoreductase [Treponema sp.]
MDKRILIVGGVAGGASVAARVRRIDETAKIIMFERGQNVSFSNCALPFFLSRTITASENLVLMSPAQFIKQSKIDARVNHEVIKIDRAKKQITVKNVQTGKVMEEKYDTLFLSPGAAPVRPHSIKGVNGKNVFTVRNVADIAALDAYINKNNVADVAVIGGGFIGIEVAENLKKSGKNVTLIEALDQVLAPFDTDMAQILHKALYDNGVTLCLGSSVSAITAKEVTLASGTTVKAQAVVLAIGVRPETELAQKAGLALGETGAILVDHNYKTSDPDIYAVGDAVEVFNRLTHKKSRLTLAGPAQRQARAAADHRYGIPHNNNGVIGSSVVRVFDMNAASTGLNEKMCQAAGIAYDFVYIIPQDKVGLMPGSRPLHFKLLFEVPTGKLLGAQAIGQGAADKRIDVIAAMITMGATLEDLKELELCYSPLYGTAKDAVNHAALVALNLLYGRFRQVPVSAVRELVQKKACIIDVREPDEFAAGHVTGAKNIPLSQLRERTAEIPQNKPVYLHCRSSQRSYNAIMALQNLGWNNLYNISGSFLGICTYEYFTDQITNRKKIVTQYTFD